jgi:hypothetical protein
VTTKNDDLQKESLNSSCLTRSVRVPQESVLLCCRYFISALLIHLDDGDHGVQQAVLQAMKSLAKVKPEVMKDEAKKVYDTFRSRMLLDEVLAACQ